MSVFDFPRIRISGIMRVNVGTANNDDFTSSNPKDSAGNYYYEGEQGVPLRTFNSQDVLLASRPNLKPADYIEWLKTEQEAINANTKKTVKITPGYWNYYGSMSVWADNVKVAGVTLKAGEEITAPGNAADEFVDKILGGSFSYNRWPTLSKQPLDPTNKKEAEMNTTAVMTDVKSEGSSPGSQIFADNILLQDNNNEPVCYRSAGNAGNYDGMGSKPTKAAANYLTPGGYECFYGGYYMSDGAKSLFLNPAAAANFQCVLPFSDDFADPGGMRSFLSRHADPAKGEIKGLMIRYIMYVGMHPLNSSEEWAANYRKEDFFDRLNERQCPITGIITPWYGEDDNAGTPDLSSITVGRELQQVGGLQMKMPGFAPSPNALPLTMSPMVARLNSDKPVLSLDVGKTLTSLLPGVAGKLTLCMGKNADDPAPLPIGEIPYGNSDNLKYVSQSDPHLINANPTMDLLTPPQQNVVDLPLSPELYRCLNNEDPAYPDGGTLLLRTDSDQFVAGSVQQQLLMSEPTYTVVLNARALYTEQAVGEEPTVQNRFRNDHGTELVPATFRLVRKGKILTDLPTDETFYLISCQTIPLPGAYDNKVTAKKIGRMEDLSISVEVTQPMNYRFAVVPEAELGKYQTFVDMDGRQLVVAQVRVLPNEDYSSYYLDPNAAEPVGNDLLTFEVLYEKVFKPYHVL
ncbi:MAG: hypothetical protein WBA17_13015, partial [Saprospiraceae bacterium]